MTGGKNRIQNMIQISLKAKTIAMFLYLFPLRVSSAFADADLLCSYLVLGMVCMNRMILVPRETLHVTMISCS